MKFFVLAIAAVLSLAVTEGALARGRRRGCANGSCSVKAPYQAPIQAPIQAPVQKGASKGVASPSDQAEAAPAAPQVVAQPQPQRTRRFVGFARLGRRGR